MTPFGFSLNAARPRIHVPDAVAGMASNTASLVSRAGRLAGLSRRGVWSRPGRHHIEVHGVSRVGAERLIRQVERALERLPGVAWARVNAPSGRVVVAVRPPEPPLREIIATIARVERTDGLTPENDLDTVEPHPPEEGPRTRRALSTLAADALGLTLSAATRVLPFTPAPAEVAGLLGVVDLHPRLRALLGQGLRGDHRAESLLPLAEAVVQGLTGGWAGIVLDGALRVLQWGEARSQLAAWEKVESRLAGTPERAGAAPPQDERPCPKPYGPVEHYASRVLSAGGLAGGAALPVLGGKRAMALALATLPKAPVSAREGYAAQLGRILARCGVIAMDRTVLRELDRVDTLVLDSTVLRSGRGILTDLVPMPGADPEQVVSRAFALFDPACPGAVRHGDGWALGPVDRLTSAGRPAQVPKAVGADTGNAIDAEKQRLGANGGTVLGLADGGALVALVRMDPEPAPGVELLPAAARRAGLRLIVADAEEADRPGAVVTAEADRTETDRYDFADEIVPGGSRLADSIRRLQRTGRMVMLVSRDQRGLAAADCGLGVWPTDASPPWGAHLLVGTDLAIPALIVDAAGAARALARQSITLAGAGAGLGAVTAVTTSPERLPRATLAAVNATAGLAFAHGVWRAHRLAGQPTPVSAPVIPWHLMPVDTVLAHLDTRPAGLSANEVERRRTSGPDSGTENRMTLVHAFVEELANPLTPVLAAGAGLSAVVGSAVDAALVGGVVAGSALVGAAHRVNTERSLADLLSRSAVTARVCRDGTEHIVAAADLVRGDVIALGPGDAVPADCRVIEADALEADESSLTGESLPVAKTSQPVVAAAVADRRSMLYEGTTVAAGRGLAVVVATGNDTEVGRGMALARQAPPTSGVEARLTGLTRSAVPLAAGSAVAVGGAGLFHGVPLRETAATAANLAVASVPEGLPFLVSAAQLAAARRLAEHGALVRNPRTIEALGRVNVLCFDKTGTLTEGRLRLTGVGDGERHAGIEAVERPLRPILAAALRATPEPAEESERPAQQTDEAVLAGAVRAKIKTTTGLPDWRHLATLPFEPSRGYHATLGVTHGRLLLSVKGAPETVLARCNRLAGPDGGRPLGDESRRRLQDRMDRHAGAGHRILAVAERVLPAGLVAETAAGPGAHHEVREEDIEELTFVGYLTIADGVRDSAAPAVRRIRQAGVHTIMITGDHPATAAAIAATISPDGAEQRIVTATELDDLDDDALADRLARTDVVARCTPAHKVRIIQSLQKCGRTVAMTGDGANDAPAIRLADVGIALGRRGTPAARAAADLVVTDDRLETIISTLVEGRAMWSSVRHALGILVGGNLGEIAFSVLTAASTGRSALTGRQLLLVNLLTDLAPAMAIAVRPPDHDATDGLLAEGPDISLGETLSREIALRAASTTLGATAGWTLARYTGRQRRASTVALASLVGTQLGQTLLAGGASPAVLGSTALSMGVLAAVIQTPGVSQFFGCTPLGPVGWGIAAGSAVGATLANTALGRLLDWQRDNDADSTSATGEATEQDRERPVG